MENVSHTLCGLALARAGGDRLGPLATPTLVIAANIPDCDIVGAPFGGRPWYLIHHRGLTHSVVGLVALSLLLAGAAYALARRFGRKAKGGTDPAGGDERARFLGLWAAAGLGLASHLLLDSLNTYGVRPWLPFAERWYYGDVAFILDPWIWLGFGAGAALVAPRRARWSDGLWWALWTVGTLLLLFHERTPGWPAALLWSGVMLAALVGRQRVLPLPRRQLVAAAGIGLVVVYLLVLGVLDRAADARARAAVSALLGADPLTSACHPAPAVPWRFTSVVATAERIHRVEVDLRAGTIEVAPGFPRNLDDPLLELDAVKHSEEYRAWRVFARLPFVARRDDRLVLGDARYSPGPEKPAFSDLTLPLPLKDP